jgi:hypothetical protein
METQTAVIESALTFKDLVMLGCLGGIFVEALKHVRKLQSKKLPDGFDLAVSLILIAIGGGVAGVYLGQVQSMLIAVQIGATAPAIIGAWASGGPPTNGGGGGPRARRPGSGSVVLEKADVASRVVLSLSWNVPRHSTVQL